MNIKFNELDGEVKTKGDIKQNVNLDDEDNINIWTSKQSFVLLEKETVSQMYN